MGSLIGGIHTSKVYLNSYLHSPSAQHNKLIKGHKIEEKELQNIDVTMHKEAIDSPNLSVTTRPPWINKKVHSATNLGKQVQANFYFSFAIALSCSLTKGHLAIVEVLSKLMSGSSFELGSSLL